MSKNPPLTNVDKKIANCSTSSSTSIVFFSTCFSSSKSLIIMNVGIGGEQCFRRLHNVFSNPSSMITTRLSASKISHFTYVSSLEFSLLFQNTGGGLDASNSM
jgi:hypothetical protein